jgi:hypothetical protein
MLSGRVLRLYLEIDKRLRHVRIAHHHGRRARVLNVHVTRTLLTNLVTIEPNGLVLALN